ncbi:sugar phosphate isomerase/epimerase family protein [Kineococcus rubinsiae]|uniref:sugar phosphate isomerase/epimerase family protein n=1 Tax=Kineococcus rubinsiae TaxID=2609562 RepID=UPI0014310047|nr:sugar phosphate isomerase/epimerase [Kineococcus rubinsiae]NIZ92240.1 sugar phosphate isomerase/epimerase [Kineococcus rubinsiae]
MGSIPVGLSTSCSYPESTTAAFEIASRLGYDGLEVMVWTDPVSQDGVAIQRLVEHYGLPVLSIHAPTLLLTQRIWGRGDPWGKVEKSCELAAGLGASTVVVHPPFRWQRDYASGFVDGIRELERRTGVVLAVENMFPWRARGREVVAYAPGWDPTDHDYEHLTLDISHAATSGMDALALAQAFGDRLAHLHLCDGSGSIKDEHLVPGEGSQPCAEVLQHLARSGFDGNVVMEVNTRKARGRSEREAELAAALAFARTHLAMADVPGGAA